MPTKTENQETALKKSKKIVLATFGSLGDAHPKIALGLELRRRGHQVVFAIMEAYRERLDALGFEMCAMRPDIDPTDREFAKAVMNVEKGPEMVIKGTIFPNLPAMYEDLMRAVEGADLLVTGEVVYAARSVVEKTGITWVSTSLAPISFFSAYDPNVYPMAQWYAYLRFMPLFFHRGIFNVMRRTLGSWYEPYKKFRRELGLDENHDPIFEGKSKDLHLAMFSRVLAKPEPDWHTPTLQTGFCFYDGQNDLGKMPDGLREFLDAGEPPIIFTLGSAAVMDARDFFDESARAAKILNRRAVLLYGINNEKPKGLSDDIAAFEYAPYSLVFPKAAAVVHQGGVGTTSQALRAGVPHLIMPYSHDQPDNAARCNRLGVARVINRDKYSAESAVRELEKILGDPAYKAKAVEAKKIVDAEHGTVTACDAIEELLNKSKI